jgi:hypothetical protein
MMSERVGRKPENPEVVTKVEQMSQKTSPFGTQSVNLIRATWAGWEV